MMIPLWGPSSKAAAGRFPIVKSFVSLSLLWLVFLSKQLWVSTNLVFGSSKGNDNYNDGSQASLKQSLGPISASDDPLRLIFLISMGQEAMQSKLVERFVWSARHRGDWKGWIVLLTDAPVSRYEDPQDDHLIVMNPLAQHFNTTFREDMPYKRFKTYVLDYIDMDPRLDAVRLIYYLDVDIIVGNSLPKLFHDLEGVYNIPKPDGVAPLSKAPLQTTQTTSKGTPAWLSSIPKIWFFKNKYAHLTVQGGQFILDRATSKPCLTFWRELIDANVTEFKDQPALHKMRLHQQTHIDPYLNSKQEPSIPARCQIVTMEWKRYLHFPSNSTVFKAVGTIQKKKKPTIHTLIHFKNSCNSTSQINDKVEEQFIEYVVQNKDLARKIHVQPDADGNGAVKKHVVDKNGRIHLQ
ncbi:hypothetical protein IV203_034149 [Nitzschia inconspicua]|uniref:Uncharacterized protein n=1 Tax=Nitzschia inconspicua TaxID=303405 RepID=A0A9K3M579_9STRA|nr:hypothetical protein IV203_034149 [Nitzschia inconspicua]